MFPRAGAYARDVRPPSRVCRRDVGGCGRRGRTHWVSWIRVSSALLRITGVDSRYVNARFQILGRSICGAVECECVSRSIADDEGGMGEVAAREAWPRTLSQYGASWASCFDGGLATIASSTELAVSRASSRPISSGSEESKDVRRPYAACERYGFESFGRINKCVVKVLTCSRAINRGASIFRDARRWMSVSGLALCVWSTVHAHSPTRIRHGCACSGGGGLDNISWTASAALRRTFGRGSMVCSTRVLNALRRPGASSELESREEMKMPKIVMRDRREGA